MCPQVNTFYAFLLWLLDLSPVKILACRQQIVKCLMTCKVTQLQRPDSAACWAVYSSYVLTTCRYMLSFEIKEWY